MDKSKLELLCERIPKRGISKRCQVKIPIFVKNYLRGYSLNNVGKGDKKCAGKIYERIDGIIKRMGAEKLASYFGKHHTEFKENLLFVDAIMQYSIIDPNLDKELFKSLNLKDKKQENLLIKKYKEKDKEIDVQKILTKISKSKKRELYLFTLNYILYESSNQ